MNCTQQCHIDTVMAEPHPCALPQPSLFSHTLYSTWAFLPPQDCNAEMFPFCTPLQLLGHYI